MDGPITHTENGTPVYILVAEIPADVLPRGFGARGRNAPEPRGPFARWLGQQVPVRPACVIVKYRSRVRILKVWKTGEVFTVNTRAIPLPERKRLVSEGVLRGS